VVSVITEAARLRELVREVHRQGRSVGLVPTMGALHAGHRALIERAQAECDLVVVSIFVNPLQFDDPRDLEAYPRTLEADLALVDEAGVAVVFAPSVGELHPEPVWVRVSVLGGVSEPMEGAARPGHFDGVATVVTKLLVLADPERAYFGEKDYQQLLVVRRLVEELHFGATIVAVPTVRDEAGLALSSRNRRLSPTGLERARWVAGVLARLAAEAQPGEQVEGLEAAVRAALAGVELDYVAVADPPLLQRPRQTGPTTRIFLAWRVEGVRLIDNRRVGEGRD